MKVVSRNDGPLHEDYDGTKYRRGLKEGKVYDVIEWAYQDNTKLGGWIKRTDDFVNQREPRFFIKVINEYGKPADFWNDYFLSGQEMREMKLQELGI